MGKCFITDEINDNYTATVTNAKKLAVEGGASTFQILSSAMTTAAKNVSTAACWFKSIVLGQLPATASILHIFDTSSSANFGGSALTTGFAISAANYMARLSIEPTTGVSAAASKMPLTIPFDVYCASGLTVQVGELGASGTSGCLKNVTIIYQA